MNLILDPLPDYVEIDGGAWAINSCFTVGVRFELLMQDNDKTPQERIAQALTLFYPEIPPNITAAMERLLWFYGCGKEVEGTASGKAKQGPKARPKKRTPKAYCFEQDAELVFSAFWECYGIDLNEMEGL